MSFRICQRVNIIYVVNLFKQQNSNAHVSLRLAELKYNPEFSITFIRFIPTASGAKRLISGYTALKVTDLALVAGTWS